jgi:hypothetical protein
MRARGSNRYHCNNKRSIGRNDWRIWKKMRPQGRIENLLCVYELKVIRNHRFSTAVMRTGQEFIP